MLLLAWLSKLIDKTGRKSSELVKFLKMNEDVAQKRKVYKRSHKKAGEEEFAWLIDKWPGSCYNRMTAGMLHLLRLAE